MTPVDSNQVAAVGFCPETKTLAVAFKRGAGAVYQYPGVTAEQHAAFVGAESVGKHFGAHIQGLPFKKFPSPLLTAGNAAETPPSAAEVAHHAV